MSDKERAQLSHAGSWQVAVALSHEGVYALFEGEECIEALAWLGLSRDELLDRLNEIESIWRGVVGAYFAVGVSFELR